MATASLTEVFDVCEELLGTSGAYVIWLAPRDGDYGSSVPERISPPRSTCRALSTTSCLVSERAS